ncbi:extracellular polygalacturonase [Thraustotheca clavata]|uniref:endo-polygalacturonase n=1 Tax=Thraustotheca clavata TaxID=74557 RepID=A0A0A7CLH2_9STRA|nr:secreted protein [Thraustotheca clavata]OQR94957.1 extracellular polygalacturonase [Thraustotheca clavata]
MKIFTVVSALVAALATVSYAEDEAVAAGCALSGTYSASTTASVLKSCKSIAVSGLSVPGGTTLDLTALQDGSTVKFSGTTTFGVKKGFAGPLIAVSGNQVTIDGTGATLDGQGASYWDGKGSNTKVPKPKFFKSSKLTNSVVKGFKLLNTPVQAFSINQCQNSNFTSLTVDNKAGDALGHNTDAFDVGSSSGIIIRGATVYNQDDCLAVNSGTNILFTGGYCSGGHGLSIGSVGGRSDNTVQDVTISDSQIVDSDNGVRIKTVSNAKGKVTGITYSNIQLKNIKKYGVVIEQDYLNGGPTGKPTDGVPITHVTLNKITGSVAAKATNTYILCAKGACSDWKFTGVTFTGGQHSQKCQNIPAGSGATC